MDFEYDKCNLCSQDDTDLLFEQRDFLSDNPSRFRVVKCRGCGLVYINPRPARHEMHAFYTREFVSYQFELLRAANSSLRERLVSFVTRSAAMKRVELVKELLEPNAQPKVLDLGCGKGSFLYCLREQLKCAVTGMDFDAAALKYCQDVLHIKALYGDINSSKELEAKYDLITMWTYLEHEFDPLSTLLGANERLAEGGFVILQIPNADSLENGVFGSRSFLYDVPRHLYSFSPTTVRMLLDKAGFAIRTLRFPYFCGGWIGSVDLNLFRGNLFRHLQQNIYLFLLLSEIILPIDYLTSKIDRGSVMTIVAEKVRNP